MRIRRSTQFERRSALYASVDAQLYAHTRFFAAASLVNGVLAKFFSVLPAIRSPRCFEFLAEVGAALEADNLAYAREISAKPAVIALDRALVRSEQRRLQRYVQFHQAARPQQWVVIRDEINGLLNERYAGSWISNRCAGIGKLSAALREVRTPQKLELDQSDLDFADESHRVLIGLKLIEHVRRDAPAAPRVSALSVRECVLTVSPCLLAVPRTH